MQVKKRLDVPSVGRAAPILGMPSRTCPLDTIKKSSKSLPPRRARAQPTSRQKLQAPIFSVVRPISHARNNKGDGWAKSGCRQTRRVSPEDTRDLRKSRSLSRDGCMQRQLEGKSHELNKRNTSLVYRIQRPTLALFWNNFNIRAYNLEPINWRLVVHSLKSDVEFIGIFRGC